MGTIDRLEQIAQQLERLAGTTPTVSAKADTTDEGKLARIRTALASLDTFLANPTPEFDYIDFDNDVYTTSISGEVVPPRKEGRLFYDPLIRALTLYPRGDEVTQSIGHEIYATVYNDNVFDIKNGDVVGQDVTSSIPGAAHLALASEKDRAIFTVGVATEAIPIGSQGLVTAIGAVRGLDTSAWPVGTELYLSETTPGGLSSTRPDSPSYDVPVASVITQSATAGIIYVRVQNRGNTQSLRFFYDGAALEPYSSSVQSNGVDILYTLTPTSGTFLSLVFDGELSQFTAPASVGLTAGTDSVPALNYVYIPKSTKQLTANTTGFPTSEPFQPVATVFCQSAASIVNDPPYKVHSWNDHVVGANENGHLSHLNEWIRNQHATWLTGSALSATDGSTAYLSGTSGTALQLHVNTISAWDMATTGDCHIVNDPVTPYKQSTDLVADITTDSAGVSLNNKYFKLVVYLIVNSDGIAPTPLVNLPSGSYNSAAAAEADALAYADYTIDSAFRGTAIILGTVVYRKQASTWTSYGVVDMRGALIGTVGGGAGSGTTSSFSDANFNVYNSADPTKITALDVSGLTTATTRTLTIPDISGTLVLEAGAQTLTNKTIVAGNNTISGLTHGSEVDNPTSGVHGVTGSVVGTTDSQTLTNKTISPASNTIDGDILDIDYTPTNYTPDASAPEASDVDDLAAHLKGIDTAVGSAGNPSVDIQKFTTTGANTWTKPTGAVWVEVFMWGGGGGGGGGGTGSASAPGNQGGGGGGSGSAYMRLVYDASDLGTTETVIVGAGGAGGAGNSSGGGNGVNGSDGGTSYFKYAVPGGQGGNRGGTSGGTGGQEAIDSLTAGAMGGDVATAIKGGNGGLNSAGAAGGRAWSASGSGGGGGSASGNAGGQGGDIYTATGGTTGGRNGAGTDSAALNRGGTAGRGGAGNTDGAATNGSSGGIPGGGGGGGGGGLTIGTQSNGGNGGTGARGEVVVVTHF
jgi:hypothetical protein